jgi:hypothetical protein
MIDMRPTVGVMKDTAGTEWDFDFNQEDLRFSVKELDFVASQPPPGEIEFSLYELEVMGWVVFEFEEAVLVYRRF